MYSINGEFGQVRLCSGSIVDKQIPLPFTLKNGGWHKCNSKYAHKRPDGQNGYLFFFTCSSGGLIKIGDSVFEPLPDTVTIIPPFAPHEYYTKDGSIWEFYWLHILGEAIGPMAEIILEKNGYSYISKSSSKIRTLIEGLFPERFFSGNVYDIEASSVLSQIMHLLLQDIFETASTSPRKIRLVSDVIFCMETSYQKPVKLEDLARESFVSPAHLIRCFREETGYTPHEYLKKYRISKSCELLQYSDFPIRTIALEVGFSDLNNYIVQFKKEKGITPGQYRKLKQI